MTVSELTALLRQLAPDLPVLIPDDGVSFCHVAHVFQDIATRAEDGGYQLCDERDPGAVQVVWFGGPHEERRPFLTQTE